MSDSIKTVPRWSTAGNPQAIQVEDVRYSARSGSRSVVIEPGEVGSDDASRAKQDQFVPPLRVLHVLEATLGGTRRYLEDILSTTTDFPARQGLAFGMSRADSEFWHLLGRATSAGWFLAPIDAMRRQLNVFEDTRSIALLRRAIQSFQPNVLHVHSAKAGGLGRLATLVRSLSLPRVVYSPHALPLRLGKGYMLAERAFASVTDRFIAVSESERREIINEGLAPADRVDVVYPRIDTARYHPRNLQDARLELGLPLEVPVVVAIGRMVSQKDPVRFVETIAKLHERYPRTIGLWIGDGELRAAVQSRADQLDLGDNLRILGWKDDIRPYIAASDVVLSSAQYESFGYVVAEAFAMERPVVASRVTGTVDVFFEEARPLLFDPDDEGAAALRIISLLENDALRREIGRAGRLSVMAKFSDASMNQALRDSYEKTLLSWMDR